MSVRVLCSLCKTCQYADIEGWCCSIDDVTINLNSIKEWECTGYIEYL